MGDKALYNSTYGRAPNAIENSQGSLTFPSYTDTGPPFLYGDSDTPPHLVAFYNTLGIRRKYSRLKPPASSRCIEAMQGFVNTGNKTRQLRTYFLRGKCDFVHKICTQNSICVDKIDFCQQKLCLFQTKSTLSDRFNF